jgi:hypothetical protein
MCIRATSPKIKTSHNSTSFFLRAQAIITMTAKHGFLLVILLLSCLYSPVICFCLLETPRMGATATLLFGGAALLVNHVKTKGNRAKDDRIEEIMQKLASEPKRKV